MSQCPSGKCEKPERDCFGSGCISNKAEFALAAGLAIEAMNSAISSSEAGDFTTAYEFADEAAAYAKQARGIAQSKLPDDEA